MRNLLEKAIVHILNGDQGKAEALFHRFMVEKARQIHESLRQGDDVELNENWASEIREEDYFDGDDVGEEEGDEGEDNFEDEGGDEVPVGDEGEGLDDEGLGDEGFDDEGEDLAGEFAGDEAELAGDEEELAADEEGEHEELSGQIDDMEAKLDELTAEFDRLMSKLDTEEGELGDLGDEEEDLAGELGGDEAELGGDEVVDGDEDVTDMGMGGEEPSDIADRLGSDMGDENQPEHEMAEDMDVSEDDEMLEDITESVLSELDRIATPSNSEGKFVGSGGGSSSVNTANPVPNRPIDSRWQGAKPVMVKAEGDAHNDSFEREEAPSTKKIGVNARNNDAGVKKLKTVPAKGDSSAILNSDFTSRPKTQSITDGKPST